MIGSEVSIPVFPICWPDAKGECACGWDHPKGKDVGKAPRTPRGLYDASADPQVLADWRYRWPDANYGMPTGVASGIAVVDLDISHQAETGANGIEAWAELQDIYGAVQTRTHRTGSGGLHVLFLMPEGLDLRNTASKIAPGVDTRGNGGYIVVPPSVHETGAIYEVEDDWDIAPMPQWVVDHWVQAQETRLGAPAQSVEPREPGQRKYN